MRVVVRHGVGDLARDLGAIPVKARRQMRGVVRDGLRIGNDLAKGNARRSAGAHGKNYPGAFSWEMYGALSSLSGGNLIAGEYGPDAEDSGGQGGMSFEDGSRNQKPHRDLKRSQDVIGPAFHHEVASLADGWFW